MTFYGLIRPIRFGSDRIHNTAWWYIGTVLYVGRKDGFFPGLQGRLRFCSFTLSKIRRTNGDCRKWFVKQKLEQLEIKWATQPAWHELGGCRECWTLCCTTCMFSPSPEHRGNTSSWREEHRQFPLQSHYILSNK